MCLSHHEIHLYKAVSVKKKKKVESHRLRDSPQPPPPPPPGLEMPPHLICADLLRRERMGSAVWRPSVDLTQRFVAYGRHL